MVLHALQRGPRRGFSANLSRCSLGEEAVADPIVFAGTVEWSGENPGISLKEAPDGPFVALASFFRVVLSPHGRGHALVLLQAPESASPPRERANYCLHDNEALARYLVAEFVSNFGAYRGLLGLQNLGYRKLNRVEASGDPRSTYTETVSADDLDVELTWSGLGDPFCFAFPPDKSATGKHHMPSLFVGCENATIMVNGTTLRGKPVPREIVGRTITTAMLAFSETWIRAS